MNDLVPSASQDLQLLTVDACGLTVSREKGNYVVTAPNGSSRCLTRGTDFGMIRRKDGKATTKTPTLFKPGAEKVAVAYGLLQHYTVESSIEDQEKGFFFYRVRCDLVKIFQGREYVVTSSYGSANTREGRTGSQSPFDGANSALKMAQKRSLVSAALSLGCLSDAFTQDIESEGDEAQAYFAKEPSAPITPAQITFFYTAAGRHGLTKQDAKDFLKSHGYASAKEILQGDLDRLLEDMDHEKEGN